MSGAFPPPPPPLNATNTNDWQCLPCHSNWKGGLLVGMFIAVVGILVAGGLAYYIGKDRGRRRPLSSEESGAGPQEMPEDAAEEEVGNELQEHEGSVYDGLYHQLEQAMAEARNLRREAFEESQIRDKAEKDLIEMIKELEVKIVSAVEQMENYKSERDELQIELDRTLKLNEELMQNQADSIGEAPEYFICPINQDVMRDPHVAADGFSYEAESFRGWIDTGHNTSPMTNLELAHTNLVPNHTLRSGIQEWLQRQ